MKSVVKIVFLFLIFNAFIRANSLNFTSGDLLRLAQQWQQSHADIYHHPITSLRNVQEIRTEDELIAWALFPEEGGYLIISATQETTPLIGVSDRGNQQHFTDDHPLIRLLKVDLPNRVYRAQNDHNEQIDHALEWDALTNLKSTTTARLDTIIFNPTPTWGQGWSGGSRVFNLYTPNHWSAGCVATALAEILSYYHWPVQGTGSNTYSDDGLSLSVDYSDHVYDWSNTLDNYSNGSTVVQREAAGLLSFHTAVSVEMDFEAAGSTANTYDGAYALQTYFNCSGNYQIASSPGFMENIINNLKDGRPVAMAVDGPVDHAIVADGYASQYGLSHINYGWNGDSNGWYDITGAFLPGYDYTIIGALMDIVPNPMISQDVAWIDEDSFKLKWFTSFRLFANYYELQERRGINDWLTLSSTINDTSYAIDVNSPGTYHYRVRAHRDGVWWDWSPWLSISIGDDVTLKFFIDTQNRPLVEGEELVLIGNILPLGNVQNSPGFSHQSNGIFKTEVTFENSYVNETLLYRFGIKGFDYQDIETFNRQYQLSSQAIQSLDTVLFNLPVSILEADQSLLSASFIVGDVFPNPFNAVLSIPINIVQSGSYEFQIFDLNGKACGASRVKELSGGSYVIQIDFNTAHLASGVYFIRIRNAGISQIVKCQLLK